MRDLRVRQVPGNYCRNGNFQGGITWLWSFDTNLGPATTTPTGDLENSYWCQVTLVGVNGYITHADYIPVRTGEELTHSLMVTDCTVTGVSVSSVYYDGAYRMIDTDTTYNISCSGTDVPINTIHRVPNNAVYVKIRYYVLGTAGQIFKFTGASLNIQDSRISLETHSRILIEDFAVSGNVAPGASSINTLEPNDDDKIYKVLGFWLYSVAVPGATTGQHRFDIEYAYFATLISVVNNYNAVVGLPGFDISKYSTGSNPVNQYSLIATANNLYATASVPLVVRYSNGTNATQTNNRTVKAMVLESYIDNIN